MFVQVLNEHGEITYLNHQAREWLDVNLDEPSQESPLFLDIIRDIWSLFPETAWAAWPELRGTPCLVRSEYKNQQIQWLKVDSILKCSDHFASEYCLRLRDCSAAVALSQKINYIEYLMSHQLRIPITTLIDSVEWLCSYAQEADRQAIQDVAETIGSSGKYLTHALLKLLQVPNQSLCGEPAQRSIESMLLDHLPLVQTSLDLPYPIAFECTPAAGQHRPWCAESFLIFLLVQTCSGLKHFHPQKQPRLNLKVQITAKTFIQVQLSCDSVQGMEEALEQGQDPDQDITSISTGEPQTLAEALSRLPVLLASGGGYYTLRKRQDHSGLLLSFSLPIQE